METEKEKIVSLKQEVDANLEILRGSCPTTLRFEGFKIILHKLGDKVRFEQRAIHEKLCKIYGAKLPT